MHDKFSQLELDILFELFRSPENSTMKWLPQLQILVRRIIEAGYVTLHRSSWRIEIGELETTMDHLMITDKGRAFVDELGSHEL